MKKLIALLLLLTFGSPVLAQGTFPLNNLPLGKGAGKTGFTPLAPGANGTCLLVVAGVPAFSTCPVTPATVPGGSNPQIQYNNAGSFGGLTDTQVTARINAFTTSLSGAVPASGGGTTNFLRADGTFAVPPGTAVVTNAGVIPTTATVTISNASPGVITWAAHGLTANTPVFFCTTGSLPTGLTACVPAAGAISTNTYMSNPTLYYVVGSSITTNTFTVATTVANANAGIAVNTSSAGSGTQTAFANALACAGCLGEYVYNDVSLSSPFALTSGSAGQVWNTLSLTSGIWLVGGNVGIIKTAATTPTYTHMHAGIVYGFSTIPTSPFNGTIALHITSNSENGWMFANNPEIVFLTTTTTINATVTADFTGGTAGAYGKTWAIRIR